MTFKELSEMGFWENIRQNGGQSFLGAALAWLFAKLVYRTKGLGCLIMFLLLVVGGIVLWRYIQSIQ